MFSTTERRFKASMVCAAALLLLIAALASCTQGGRITALPQDSAVNQPSLSDSASPGPIAADLPALPIDAAPTEAVHGTSFVNVRAYYGNGIFDASDGAIYPQRSIVLPSTAPNGTEWVIYSMNLGGYEPDSLDLGLDVSQNGRAWIACGNFSTGRWEFFSPVSGDTTINLGGDSYLSPNGQFMVAVVAYGGSVVTVRHLAANFENLVTSDFSISGRITDEQGNPLIGLYVGITPSPGGLSIYTDANGEYTVHLPSADNYTVTPDSPMIGHEITPPNTVVDVNGHETGINFSGMVVDVRGRILTTDGVGLAGVQINLDPGGLTTYTGADGRYELSDVSAGNKTVTPLLAGYTFAPNFEAINVAAIDVVDVDFEATGGAPTYSIFGTIETAASVPVEGVFITLNPGFKTAVTDSAGNYFFSGVPAGSFTIEPKLGLWSFSPVERVVEVVASSLNNQDFEGTAPPPTFSVSGTVSWDAGDVTYGIPDIDVIISETSNGPAVRTAETDVNGNYTIFDVPSGFYFMRVNGGGYNPEATSVNVTNANVSGKNIFTELADGPTWENFAASYVADHCVQCHRPDSQTSVNPNLRTYEEVVDAGTASNARIQNNNMPPGYTNLTIYQRYFSDWRLANYPED